MATISDRVANIYLDKKPLAMLINGVIFSLPGLFVLALITTAFVTLRQGAKSGLMLIIGSSVFASLLAYLYFYITSDQSVTNTATFNFIDILLYYLGVSALIFILATVLKYTVSFRLMTHCLIFLFAFGAMTVINISFIKDTMHNAVKSQIMNVNKKLEKQQESLSDAEAYSIERQEQIKETVAMLQDVSGKGFNEYYAYLVLVFMVVFFAMNFCLLCVARQWQASLFNKGGFAKEFTELKAFKFVLAIVAFAFLTTILEQYHIFSISSVLNYTLYVGLQALYIISFFILVITGLAFMHWAVKTLKLSPMYLWMTYIMLFFVYTFVPCITALVIISIFDSLIDLKKFVIKYKKG